jgi:hypothetical protein
MNEPDSGDGGFTGNADGAPYTGYDAGTALQSPGDVPANPSGLSPEQLKHLEESDKPIEYDPIGQALVSLPVSLAQGAVAGAAAGASMLGELGKEGAAWLASEVGIGAAEHLVEGSSEHGSDGVSEDSSGGAGGADGGTPDQPDAGYDPSAEGAGYE